jgi:alcohol dehydrogenase class IV
MAKGEGNRPSMVCGPGAVATLPVFVAVRPGGAIVILTPSSRGAVWRERLLAELGTGVEVFDHNTGPPTPQAVAALEVLAERCEAELLIAIGGGSAIDLAKAARTRLAGRRPTQLVAVPTVPGAGTEVTPFATIWDFERGRKSSVLGVPPDLVLVDPELNGDLVGPRLAGHAMDALTHGAEAAWSVRSTPESVAFGLAAISLLVANLEAAIADPSDLGARLAVGMASVYGGQAITIAQTSLCHALSYPMTIDYRTGHAEASSLTLGSALAFVATTTEQDCTDPRGASHVRAVAARIFAALRAVDAPSAVARVDRLRSLAEFPLYRTYGFDEREIAEQALTYGRIANTPRNIDLTSLDDLLLRSGERQTAPC